jgi:hypothetical protein
MARMGRNDYLIRLGATLMLIGYGLVVISPLGAGLPPLVVGPLGALLLAWAPIRFVIGMILLLLMLMFTAPEILADTSLRGVLIFITGMTTATILLYLDWRSMTRGRSHERPNHDRFRRRMKHYDNASKM